MSVRFATVLFQTGTSITSLGESLSALAMWIIVDMSQYVCSMQQYVNTMAVKDNQYLAMWISVVLLVIFSIAHMKMSEMIEIPKKLEIYLLTDTCLTSSLEAGTFFSSLLYF